MSDALDNLFKGLMEKPKLGKKLRKRYKERGELIPLGINNRKPKNEKKTLILDTGINRYNNKKRQRA